jgi:hypothetical protein
VNSHFLGFQYWDPVGGEQAKTWDLRFLRSWKLVKILRHTAGLDWNGNTEGWEV